jgi:uncharacterized membrane protein YeiB
VLIYQSIILLLHFVDDLLPSTDRVDALCVCVCVFFFEIVISHLFH